MSRVYEALQQTEKEQGQKGASQFPQTAGLLGEGIKSIDLDGAPSVDVKGSSSSRLVALYEPQSLGAEKFRALVARLENLRQQKELRSLQITSAVINEGKTLVAANLAISFAKHSHSKVLLLEGDLRRPSIATLLGAVRLRGLSHWWSEPEQDVARFLYRLADMSLWILTAGASHEQPSHILRSKRFAEAFNRLAACFDWIIVDSTPMLLLADVTLWSRLVDGTVLVVREGVAPVAALKRGLESVDGLKLVGTVINEASDSYQGGYGQYYGVDRGNRSKTDKSA